MCCCCAVAIVSWLFVVGHRDHGWLLLGRGDVALATIICLWDVRGVAGKRWDAGDSLQWR